MKVGMADPYEVQKSNIYPGEWAVVRVADGREMKTYKARRPATLDANRRNREA
jgi:hypothetical protein